MIYSILLLIFTLKVTAKAPAYPDNVLISKEVLADGSKVATYSFIGVDDKKKCTPDNKCYGWIIKGQYKIITEASGLNYFEISGMAKSKTNFDSGSFYGVSFNFPFGKDDMFTEQIIFVKRFGEWAANSLRYTVHYEEVLYAPISSYLNSIFDNRFKVLKFVQSENTIEFSARREFLQNEPDRTWTLGQSRPWIVHFFDDWHGIREISSRGEICNFTDQFKKKKKRKRRNIATMSPQQQKVQRIYLKRMRIQAKKQNAAMQKFMQARLRQRLKAIDIKNGVAQALDQLAIRRRSRSGATPSPCADKEEEGNSKFAYDSLMQINKVSNSLGDDCDNTKSRTRQKKLGLKQVDGEN